jgi:ATP adenylyltransferase
MNTIWAPWRAEYIVGSKPSGCIFCDAHNSGDKLLITEGTTCLAIMNRFPYTSGHCLIAPHRHVGDITALSADESAEMDRLMKMLVAAIRKIMKPDGFNIGMNIGSVAGAGIEDHLHLHIVPRWKGDTNFLPVIGEVHLASQHLETTLAKIKESLG